MNDFFVLQVIFLLGVPWANLSTLFFLLFALDHTEYCVNQCIIYLACIGIGVLFLCLQHVRRV